MMDLAGVAGVARYPGPSAGAIVFATRPLFALRRRPTPFLSGRPSFDAARASIRNPNEMEFITPTNESKRGPCLAPP